MLSFGTARTRHLPRSPAPTKVLFVDGKATRQHEGMVALIDAADDLTVMGSCAGTAAERLVALLEPDVVLLDADLRGPEGRRRLGVLLATSGWVRVMVVTDVADPVAVIETLAAGGSGYLLRSTSGARLVYAIHDVMEGRVPIEPRLVTAIRDRLLGASPAAVQGREFQTLTPRERTVLAHVAVGMTNDEIAAELVLARGTVKLHVQHVIAKLGVANRTQAAVYAARRGLSVDP